jgi:hypothetical protein
LLLTIRELGCGATTSGRSSIRREALERVLARERSTGLAVAV